MNTSIAVMKKRTMMQQQKAAPLRFSFSEEKCSSNLASTKRNDTGLIWYSFILGGAPERVAKQ